MLCPNHCAICHPVQPPEPLPPKPPLPKPLLPNPPPPPHNPRQPLNPQPQQLNPQQLNPQPPHNPPQRNQPPPLSWLQVSIILVIVISSYCYCIVKVIWEPFSILAAIFSTLILEKFFSKNMVVTNWSRLIFIG